MKNVHRRKWMGLLLIMILLMTSVAGGRVYAAEASTANKSITLHLTEELGTSKANVGFTLYKVGDWNPKSERWSLINSLSSTEIIFSNLTKVAEWKSAAETLSKEEGLTEISKTEGKTNEEGKLTFGTLEYGMYLIVQTGENSYGSISPFLVSLPYKVGGVYQDQITVTPKAAAFPPKPENNGSGNDSNENQPGGNTSTNTPGGNSGASQGQNKGQSEEKVENKQENSPQLILVSPVQEEAKKSETKPAVKEPSKKEEKQEGTEPVKETEEAQPEEPETPEEENFPEEEASQETVAETPVSPDSHWTKIIAGAAGVILVLSAGGVLIAKKSRKDKE